VIPDGEPRASLPGLGLIVLLGAMSTFAAISIEMYLPALPIIAADLKARTGAVELTISAFLIALAAGQLIYGPLSDRIGRKRPLLMGLTLYTAASVACALAANVDQLIVFRFAQALGGCAGVVVTRAVVRDLFPTDRVVHILASISLVTGLAPLLAPLLGGAMLHFTSWRAILWTQAGFGAGMVLAVTVLLKESLSALPPKGSTSLLSAYGAVLSSRKTMGYILTGGLGGSVLFIYGACLPAIAMNRYGLSPQQLSWVLALGAGGMMAFAQLNRPLLRRFHRDRILKAANSLSVAVGLLLCVVAWSGVGGFPGLIAPMLLILALRGLSMPLAAAGALVSEDRHVGVTAALVGAGSFAWGAAFSALPSRFADGSARPMAAVMLLALVLATVVLWRVVPTKSDASPAAP
jgi:DHA1 family bicyclomycin/chloramphenicol resistance-like MFS transporter